MELICIYEDPISGCLHALGHAKMTGDGPVRVQMSIDRKLNPRGALRLLHGELWDVLPAYCAADFCGQPEQETAHRVMDLCNLVAQVCQGRESRYPDQMGPKAMEYFPGGSRELQSA